jgi:AbrB family looped-hinge helix DNA binding protein
MIEAKLSSKNQIVIPREAREALKAKPGDRLQVVVRGESVLLMGKPKRYSKAIRGLGRKRYPNQYVEKERGSWR